MRRKFRRISKKIKSEILSKALSPGIVKSELARSHNISKSKLYKWLSKHRHHRSVGSGNNGKSSSSGNFIEVKVLPSSGSVVGLEKASLIFKDFSLVMEGQLSSKQLISIFRALEEEQC